MLKSGASLVIEPTETLTVIDVNTGKARIDYSVGEKVNHEKFGTGIVLSVKPMGNDALLEIAFDEVGTKKIMSNFAMMKKADQ